MAGDRRIAEAVLLHCRLVDIQHQRFGISVTTLGSAGIETIVYSRCASWLTFVSQYWPCGAFVDQMRKDAILNAEHTLIPTPPDYYSMQGPEGRLAYVATVVNCEDGRTSTTSMLSRPISVAHPAPPKFDAQNRTVQAI